MGTITVAEVSKYVEDNISTFHQNRLKSLEGLSLEKLLLRKNPYLFKAKNIVTGEAIVKLLLDAHLSSQEETVFGGFLEGLAIFINGQVYGGQKSSAEGIDLEFTKDSVKYIVSIKSGPNWGNSGQIAKMVGNFAKAKRILGTNTSKQHVVSINGCCYGRCNTPDKKEGYLKYCGQVFWEFISGNSDLYVQIIEPLGHEAKVQNQAFTEAYAKVINNFTLSFLVEFRLNDGSVDWEKLVKLNSAKEKPKKPKKPRALRKNKSSKNGTAVIPGLLEVDEEIKIENVLPNAKTNGDAD